MGKLIFVTGTDTGVGKTVFTASLLHFLRRRGERAWALKPFCCGGRQDAELLFQLQDGELPIDVINPVHFPEPLAPLVAARKHRQRLAIAPLIESISCLQAQVDWLIIEGCGGLLVPLVDSYTVADFIAALNCRVVVVAANELGVINHTLMTTRILSSLDRSVCAVMLMNQRSSDLASETNGRTIAEFIPGSKCFEIPYLGTYPDRLRNVKKNFEKLENTLAQFLNETMVTTVRDGRARGDRKRKTC